MRPDRRTLLISGAAAFAFTGMARNVAAQSAASGKPETYVNAVEGYGPLKSDSEGMLDLPEGFSYEIISRGGEAMADGLVVPGQFDGMGCFPLEGSLIALVRNHELRNSVPNHRDWGPGGRSEKGLERLDGVVCYDTDKARRPLPGGTTTLVYDTASGRTVSQHLSLAGTSTNCCGGQTPWGSWLTCEETEETPADADVTKDHGYVFEVPASAMGLADPVPLKAMGRFSHEAACVDPRTGVVYLTEDRQDGLFYRFIPTVPGELAQGGRLQAMVLRAAPGADTSNGTERLWSTGDWWSVDWIDLTDVESPNADLRNRGHAAGAALVARGEGIHWGQGELYLTATSGGPMQRGQVLRYVPSYCEGDIEEKAAPGRIQLFVESTDVRTLNMADNLTVAPWGHLVLCEDNYSTETRNHLKGIDPEGRVYTIGRNVLDTNSEFTGAVFSPDGRILFVNVQYPGLTFAIRGPWSSIKA